MTKSALQVNLAAKIKWVKNIEDKQFSFFFLRRLSQPWPCPLGLLPLALAKVTLPQL